MTWGVGAGHDERMKDKAGRALAESLAEAVNDANPDAAERVMTRLAGLDGRGWLRLDESARRTYWGRSPLGWVPGWWWRLGQVTGWRAGVTVGGSGIAAVAGSMCRDGRVREAAVAMLARTPGPVAAAALAVRTADWVPQVSSAAVAAALGRTEAEDAAVMVPIMLALRERWRGRQAADRYLARLAEGPTGTLRELGRAGERCGQLWALDVRAGRGLLTAGELEARAMRDRDPVVALWCARQLAAPSGQLPAGAGPRLLGSARAAVRAFAAGHLADDLLPREVLRALLADRSGAVRSVARWRWTRRGEDPGPVYRELLTAPLARQVAAALEGLDDGGDSSLPAAAVPFLAHPSPRVRCAAIHAVGRHSEPGDIPALLAPVLRDDSGKVVTAALRYLRGYHLPPSVLAELDMAGTARSRRTALAIRQHLGAWDRVQADLTAINGSDPDLAETGRTDLLAWLQHDAATTYGRPPPSQAAQIAALLATSTLTSGQRRAVAFVAGIRTPATG
jgi:hypothetical protein